MCRLHMSQVNTFVKTQGLKNLKVVFLVRDPRAMYSSVKALYNKSKTGWRTLCDEMLDDVKQFAKIKSIMPNKFFFLRYEDLVLDIQNESRKLMKNLGLKYSKTLDKYIKTHSHIPDNKKTTENPHSLFRETQENAFKWTQYISSKEAKFMETICNDVMDKMGYEFVPSNWTTGQVPRLLKPIEI